jgi:hypothetical protein
MNAGCRPRDLRSNRGPVTHASSLVRLRWQAVQEARTVEPQSLTRLEPRDHGDRNTVGLGDGGQGLAAGPALDGFAALIV